MTPLIISADDYAYSQEVDRGIVQLIEMGRLTATSCLVMSRRWPGAARALTSAVTTKADIGLHLDFTEFGLPLRHPLSALMILAFASTLPPAQIRATVTMQLDKFEQACGRMPDYIDGHQHVHQLPQIRETLLDELLKRYSGKKPWIRISAPPEEDGFKGKIIRRLGAEKLARLATHQGFECSDHLLGVYDFNNLSITYLKRLEGWLIQAKSLPGRSVLMCHPAIIDDRGKEGADPIYPARLEEFSALANPEFEALLAAQQIVLQRGKSFYSPQ